MNARKKIVSNAPIYKRIHNAYINHTYTHTCTRTHTYIRTYVCTYMHTYIHTAGPKQFWLQSALNFCQKGCQGKLKWLFLIFFSSVSPQKKIGSQCASMLSDWRSGLPPPRQWTELCHGCIPLSTTQSL